MSKVTCEVVFNYFSDSFIVAYRHIWIRTHPCLVDEWYLLVSYPCMVLYATILKIPFSSLIRGTFKYSKRWSQFTLTSDWSHAIFFVPAEFKFHAWCPCCFKIWFNYFWKKLFDTEWLRLGHELWKKESQMILNSGPQQVFSSRSKHLIMQFPTSSSSLPIIQSMFNYLGFLFIIFI